MYSDRNFEIRPEYRERHPRQITTEINREFDELSNFVGAFIYYALLSVVMLFAVRPCCGVPHLLLHSSPKR